MTRTSNFRSKRGERGGNDKKRISLARSPPEQDETMAQQDTASITTLIGSVHQPPILPFFHENRVVTESFVIPPPIARNDDDNISVLTDSSWMMDEEEDAGSQVAASVASVSWTVVTSATDSTTIPAHNTQFADTRAKRRQVVSVPYDNGPFKRRRKG